jgi:hypothetical protein
MTEPPHRITRWLARTGTAPFAVYAVVMVNVADASATSAWVRSPAGRP